MTEAVPRDESRPRRGLPWEGLAISLGVHALIVAVLSFFPWPGRKLVEPPPPIAVQLVLGEGRGGAQGGGPGVEEGVQQGETRGGPGTTTEPAATVSLPISYSLSFLNRLF